jgi:NTE family protein
VVLTDGGVYDNLGLETAYKRYKTILVSDAGGETAAEEEPKHDWARHSYRVLNIIDRQVRSLRKRQLMHAIQIKERSGTYWGIRSNIEEYSDPKALPCPFDRTTELAELATRLKRMPDDQQERLINWGYAISDAAIRTWVDHDLPQGKFPYAVGV